MVSVSNAWIEDGIGSSLKQTADPTVYLFRMRELKPRPPLGLILGDIANNLRGALDHLAWQLVLASGKTPGFSTAFPVVTRCQDWDSAQRRRLRNVRQEWAEMIHAEQPFHADEPAQHALAVLERVNNANKHSVISALFVSEFEAEPEIQAKALPGTNPDDLILEVEPLWRSGDDLVDGAVIARVRFNMPVESARLVRVPGHLSLGFDVDPPVEGEWPDIVGEVDRILTRFEVVL